MGEARVYVDRIEIQKDKYLPRSKDTLLDGAIAWDTDEFLASEEDQAVLFHFKRFVVTGRIEADGGIGSYQVIISVRGNIVTFAVSKESPVTPYGLFWAFENYLFSWNHRRHHQDDTERPLLAVDDERAPAIRATVRDGFWFADVLHHMKDQKKGTMISNFPEAFIRR